MNIREEMDKIIQEDGPWTAHFFEFPDGSKTLTEGHAWDYKRAILALNQARLMLGPLGRPYRVLDIGCLEGGIAIALAREGCETVGVEIRPVNLRKAEFAAKAFGLKNVSFVQGDMLALKDLQLGSVDLIVAAGTLYHVDAPDLQPFLKSLNELCSGLVMLDTHICMEPKETYTSEDRIYYGESFVEHSVNDDLAVKTTRTWASAVNNHAFWPTERSLANFLMDAGFYSVFRPLLPLPEWEWQDRAYWVAVSSQLAQKRQVVVEQGVFRLSEPDDRQVKSPAILSENNSQLPNPLTDRIERDVKRKQFKNYIKHFLPQPLKNSLTKMIVKRKH